MSNSRAKRLTLATMVGAKQKDPVKNSSLLSLHDLPSNGRHLLGFQSVANLGQIYVQL